MPIKVAPYLWVILASVLGVLLWHWGVESAVGPVQVGTRLFVDLPAQLISSTAFACLAGALAACMAMAIGIPIGVGAAYFRGVGGALLRVPMDILSTVPRYILIVFLFSIYGKGLTLLIVGCAVACIPTIAESVRAHVSAQLAEGRFLAFYAHGLSPRRILWFHFILVGARRLLAREFIAIVALFIVTEASLAYIDPFVYQSFSASWGMMLSRLLHGGHVFHPHAVLLVIWVVVFLLGMAEIRRRLEVTP